MRNKLIKEKIGRISIVISAILYVIIAFDYLENKDYWFFIGLGLIGIVNFIVLILKKVDSTVLGIIVNSLNFLAAGLIMVNQFQKDGRYVLWSGITCAYLIVTILFIKRRRAKI